MEYRQKPVTVQAFQLTRDVRVNAPAWFAEALNTGQAGIDECLVDGSIRMYGCTIRTPQGRMKAKLGDYIVREPDGSLCVRKDTKFEQLYTEVE